VTKRPLHRIAVGKCREIAGFWRHTRTPLDLTLDTLRLKSAPFVAVSSDSIKLRLRPGSGESFTFYENLIRRDYLANGIRLGAGATVIDIGANIGSFTVLAGSIVGATGRVISFEPVSETFSRLQANVALNGLQNVVACREAVDGRDGTIEIRIGAKSALSTAYDGIGPTEETVIETAPCSSMASIFDRFHLDRVQLLKIDCEGGEYGIFRSLTPDLASRIDQIAMEVHMISGESIDALARTVQSLGFSITRFGMNWVAMGRHSEASQERSPG
jgi:FkbM family methyltransferase